MTFNGRLKALIAEENVTWKQVSQELSIGKNQPKYWEDNGTLPDGKTLIKLSQFFGVSVDYLLGIDAEKVRSMEQASRTENSESDITDQEKAIISAFRSVNDYGKLRIIQAVMNIKDDCNSEGIKVYRAARSSTDTAPTVEIMSPEDLRKYKSAKKVTSEEDL